MPSALVNQEWGVLLWEAVVPTHPQMGSGRVGRVIPAGRERKPETACREDTERKVTPVIIQRGL